MSPVKTRLRRREQRRTARERLAAEPIVAYNNDQRVRLNTTCLKLIWLWPVLLPPPAAGAGFEGCPLFPPDNVWNARIDDLPVHPDSGDFVAEIGIDEAFHPDFGAGTWDGGPIGIPWNVVGAGQPARAVDFYYHEESDPGPYPIPEDPKIEWGSDHHILIVDRDACVLYELYDAWREGDAWHAGSGAVFPLNSNALRPAGWTSADAAGLPIFPGLVRYEEAASGEIRHALRFTAPRTRDEYVWPGRHFASDLSGRQYPPMGQRFRLKADFDISAFSPLNQAILRALQQYGMILADNGAAWYLSGAPDERWDNDELGELKGLRGGDFEAVDSSGLIVEEDSGRCLGRRAAAARGDFSGNGSSEIGIFRPDCALWSIRGWSRFYLGREGDRAVPEDYGRSGRFIPAVYRPASGLWAVRGWSRFYFGQEDDIPVPGGYDATGRLLPAVFRPGVGAWIARGVTRAYFGASGDQAVPGRWAGGGAFRPGIFRPATGLWNVRGLTRFYLGREGDLPVVGDFSGDGTEEAGIYRPATGRWFIRGRTRFYFGAPGDIPLGADYDGDATADPGIFRPAAGLWKIRLLTRVWFGRESDLPLGGW